MSAAKGRLYLVPAPLDFGCDSQAALSDTLPAATLQVAAGLGHWICENAKSTRAYLKRVGEVVPLAQPLQALSLQELPRDVHKKGDLAAPFDARPMLIPAMEGRNMGLVSEAGMPASLTRPMSRPSIAGISMGRASNGAARSPFL